MTGGRLRVAVIMGGASSEREVSLKSGEAVINALDQKKYRIMTYEPPQDIVRLVDDADCLDVALVMMHGRGGEDGSMQGLLDIIGVPYQCSGVLGCALAMDKVMAKDRFRQAGLPVAPDMVIDAETENPSGNALKDIGLPLVVKPSREGSSFGVTICTKESQVRQAIDDALALDKQVIVEKFISGRELTCGLIGEPVPEPLPLVEIIPGEGHQFFDYVAKYTPGVTNEVCPAPLDEEMTKKIQDLAVQAHKALGLERYSRIDFILGEDGPIILEANTVPGMTENSLLPLAGKAAGMTFSQLMDRLIELALRK